MQTLHCIVSKSSCVSLSHHVTRMKSSGNCGVVSVGERNKKAFFQLNLSRLRQVPHFSSGRVEWAKRERAWKSPHARKGDACRVSPFLAWGDFHARSRFAHSTIPEEKWGTTRSLEFIGSIYRPKKLKSCTIQARTLRRPCCRSNVLRRRVQ